MKEVWEVCEDFPDFAVSVLGEIQDIEKQRFVPSRPNKQGFWMVTIRDSMGQHVTRSVALLVVKAFAERMYDHFDSVIHLNGDRSDCRAANLMWRSRPLAKLYHEMFNYEPYKLAVYIPSLNEFYPSLREACTTYGLVERKTFINMYNKNPCWPYNWLMEEVQE